MATFRYTARDTRGNVVSGIIEALEEKAAAQALRAQGLFPSRIEAAPVVAGAAAVTVDGPSFSAASPSAPAIGAQSSVHAAPFLMGVPLPELAMFYRQLATLANAGVPMVQALTTLATQTRNGRLRGILNEAAQTVASGHPLSRTLERHPTVFETMQIEMIRAAEHSGMLERMCNRIADYLEREIEIRRKLKKETLYPKIVLFVAACVALLLGFLKSGSQGFWGLFRFGAAVVIGGFALWWAGRFLNQFPAIGAAWDEVKMLIPGPGGVLRKYATARFTRALGALYGGGVLLMNAVPIAARACGNRAIGQALVSKSYLLQQGQGIAEMLAASGLLSPIAVQMARTGEQTGSLDTMMDKVADYLEDEADQKSHQLAVFAGVGALILAAMVVGYIAFSFYGGMFGAALSEAGKE